MKVTARTISLNGPLVRRLRLAGGMSRRELAPRLNVSQTAIRSIEEGRNHDELTVRHLRLLADVLGVPPAELFLERPASTSERTDEDTQRVIAALTSLRTPIHRDTLARWLGWTLPRTATALANAAATLDGTGGLVQLTSAGEARLMPAPTRQPSGPMPTEVELPSLGADALRLLKRLQAMSTSTARERHLSRRDRRQLAVLMEHGLVDEYGRPADDRPRITTTPST